jgi:NAD(P)-dependent dehydrogenase (short-subunit alcohol dehydrogenase family)
MAAGTRRAMSDTEFPPQQQERPGYEGEMEPEPHDEMRGYTGSGKLEGRRALITGGDSGIGRAVAAAFAKEGADVAIAYLAEDEDAEHTVGLVEAEGRKAHPIRADLSREEECRRTVAEAVEALGGLDVLVNHIAFQNPVDDFAEITTEQWHTTFRTNVDSFFWTTKAALEHLTDGGAIVNTGSVNGLRGNKSLIDYAASKGAVHVLTYSLAQNLLQRGIRVNCVAPGPVWTPLIPSTMPAEKVESFGGQVPMGRAAQPDEIAPSYVFFASEQLSSYYTGEVMAAIGGETTPGG